MKFVPETKTVIEQEILEKEWKEAKRFGRVAMGETVLFYPSVFKAGYLPYSDIVWAYMRQEDCEAKMCCGRTTIESFFLMAVTSEGKLKKAAAERKENVKQLLEVIQQKNPQVETGYSKEKAEKYQITGR
jgi:hypothetical protein